MSERVWLCIVVTVLCEERRDRMSENLIVVITYVFVCN